MIFLLSYFFLKASEKREIPVPIPFMKDILSTIALMSCILFVCDLIQTLRLCFPLHVKPVSHPFSPHHKKCKLTSFLFTIATYFAFPTIAEPHKMDCLNHND